MRPLGHAAIGGSTLAKHCSVCGKPPAASKVVGDSPGVCGRACAEEFDRQWIEAAPPNERAQRMRNAAAAAGVRAKAAGEDADDHHQWRRRDLHPMVHSEPERGLPCLPETHATPTVLASAVEALLASDPGICAVTLIGSSVYAPERARDTDFVVVSSLPLAPSVYGKAISVARPDAGPTDVVPLRIGQELGRLRLAVAAGMTLFGVNDATIATAVATMADFAEARSWLITADTMLQTAKAQQGEQATRFAQEAFQALFHGARTAAMALLGLTEHRCGEARRALPQPLRQQFSAIIDNCHIRYGYEARFPGQPAAVQELFAAWRAKASDFIAAAEREARKSAPGNLDGAGDGDNEGR